MMGTHCTETPDGRCSPRNRRRAKQHDERPRRRGPDRRPTCSRNLHRARQLPVAHVRGDDAGYNLVRSLTGDCRSVGHAAPRSSRVHVSCPARRGGGSACRRHVVERRTPPGRMGRGADSRDENTRDARVYGRSKILCSLYTGRGSQPAGVHVLVYGGYVRGYEKGERDKKKS